MLLIGFGMFTLNGIPSLYSIKCTKSFNEPINNLLLLNEVEIPNPINSTDQDNEKVKFGESVYVGSKNIYISALSADNGRGKVFIYPFLNTSRTDENPWTNPYIIQPSSTLENAHFGYKISEKGNKVSISTFNQKTIYNYQISELDKLELVDQLTNTSSTER